MRIAYLDCFSGISGNMCLGALVDAGLSIDWMRETLGALPLHGYQVTCERVMRRGISATFVDVKLDRGGQHPHRGLSDVLEIIQSAALPAKVKDDSAAVFRELAAAEAKVHDTDVDRIHFHEVGAVDAICDIVGTAAGLYQLGVERLLFGRVHMGGGTVQVAHGLLPVPAPATAELLRGVPTAGGPVDRELTTPTGAAILRALGEPSPSWPPMALERVGYGAGNWDPDEVPNVLRLGLGQSGATAGVESDNVWVIETNLDDMTGEEVGYCVEKLLEAGALDAFTAPVQMKKNRPGVLLTLLCEPDALRELEDVIWRHTSTLGVRRSLWHRSKLAREFQTVNTPWGSVRMKVCRRQGELLRAQPEYEDCRDRAQEHGVPLRQVYQAALSALHRES